MREKSNKERLIQIASALQELNAEVVFVGGAVIQLYSKDPAAGNPATTYDVDCVVDVTTYREYTDFEQKLFSKHFANDTSEGAPVCRYLFDGEKVDFMPKVDTGIGESNRWYLEGTARKQVYQLNDSLVIHIMPLSFYLASKIEALHSRGGDDYRGSKDFEDIVYVLNTCGHLSDLISKKTDPGVFFFLKDSFSSMLTRPNLLEEIECGLLDEGRTSYIINQMQSIVNNK